MSNTSLRLNDLSKKDEPLVCLTPEDKVPLPPPFDKIEEEPALAPLPDKAKDKYVCLLDDTIVLNLPKPKNNRRRTGFGRQVLVGPRKTLFQRKQLDFFAAPAHDHGALCKMSNLFQCVSYF